MPQNRIAPGRAVARVRPKMPDEMFYRGSLGSAFLTGQKRKWMRVCLKAITKNRCDYPKLWVLPEEGISRDVIIHGLYEKQLMFAMLELAKRHSPMDVMLDIGANIGNHSLFFSSHVKQVLAFEPTPANACLLRANLYTNSIGNVRLTEKGLGDEPGKLPLFHSSGFETNNGFVEPGHERVDENTCWVEVAQGDTELANLLSQGQRVSVVKIDVEGFEPKVISGLRETFKQHKPIVFWEAFEHEEARKSETVLREIGYQRFFHLSTKPSKPTLRTKLQRAFDKAYYLVPLDDSAALDGMNVAIWE